MSRERFICFRIFVVREAFFVIREAFDNGFLGDAVLSA